jgi:hypothetical protein
VTKPDVSQLRVKHKYLLKVLLIICLILLLIVCAILLRMLYVRFRFIRTTRQWKNLEVRPSIAASWLWTTLVLRTYGFSFSPATPLESIGIDKSVKGWPEEVREPLMQLAEICNNAEYKREVPEAESHSKAWNIAHSLNEEAIRNAKWWRRVAFRFTRVLP